MVSSLLEVQNMAFFEKLPPSMTVETTTTRIAPESSVSVVTDAEGMAKNGVDTLEMLMFPCLFPQGTGAYRGAGTIHQYVKHRAKQGFSLFTFLGSLSALTSNTSL